GDLVGALRTFQRAEQLARRTDAERTEEAVRRQVAIEARVGSLRVRARDDDTIVEVNGLRAPLGERVVLLPGTYDVVAHAAGRRTATTRAMVVAGKHDVVVDVGMLAPLETRSDEHGTVQTTRLGPWLVLGSGLASLGVGGVAGLLAANGRSKLDDLCPNYP